MPGGSDRGHGVSDLWGAAGVGEGEETRKHMGALPGGKLRATLPPRAPSNHRCCSTSSIVFDGVRPPIALLPGLRAWGPQSILAGADAPY